MISTAPVLERPLHADRAVLEGSRDGTVDPAAPVGPVVVQRVWDLRPGDHFHGRTIAAIHAVVGLASSPVAVICLTGPDPEHPRQVRVGVTHTDTECGHDELRPLARAWVREHGLAEGQPVDLPRLKTDVLAAIAEQ